MEVDLNYDKPSNVMHQKLHGACNIDDLASLFDRMHALSPAPGLRVLTDITDAHLEAANLNSVSYLEKRLDRFLDKYLPIRKAIVAESDLEFGIARMFEALAEKDGYDVHVFRDTSSAQSWLTDS